MSKIYTISLSNKAEILADQEDFDKLVKEIGSGNFIKIKKGIINPSFIVSILASEEVARKREGYLDEEKGVYVLTKDTIEDKEINDDFAPNLKQLS